MTTSGVLVAGAGPGVSGHLARLVAAEGHPLALLGADADAVEELRAELAALVPVAAYVVDLTDDVATRRAVTDACTELGAGPEAPLRAVHFNPSAFRECDPLELTPAELAEDVALGVGALLSVVQAARPFLGAGSRVSVTGSMAADEPWHRAASLGVQKAGVRNLVLSLDETLRDDGIRAVSVTVRGTLAEEGTFARSAVARAVRASWEQAEGAWRAELDYPARPLGVPTFRAGT
ncbi:MAG: short-chain dehydrogenase [Nocardioides sp.]|nr:short-chain dehydrogenase [Nocardioides sp.]